MFNELFTTPCSPVFAGIAIGFIGFIKPTQQILKPIGKGTGDNLTVRIEMKCRHQISNTLLYNLSTSVFVDENWCSSGLALSVHNVLSWAHCYEAHQNPWNQSSPTGLSSPWLLSRVRESRIRKIPLPKGSLNCFHRLMNWDHNPPAPTGAKISGCFLVGGFVVIEDVVLILRMIDEFPWIFTGKIRFVVKKLFAPRAQQARKRELFLLKDFRPCCYEETYEAWRMEQEGSCYLVMAWYWRSRIFRGKLGNTLVKCECEITLKTTQTAMLNYGKQRLRQIKTAAKK